MVNKVFAVTLLLVVIFLSTAPVLPVKAEPRRHLQDWLNANGYTIDVWADELGIEIFPKGEYEATLLYEEAAYKGLNKVGFYEAGTTVYNQIFSGPDEVGTKKQFTATNTFGLYLDSPDGFFFSENALQPDGFDHVLVYTDTEKPSGYVVSFEDLWNGGDQDYDNLVFELTPLSKPPHAEFTWSPSLPKALEPVTFDATASTPNGGTIVSYDWDFGDGNTTTTPAAIVAHAYSNPGTCNVTLTVTNSESLTDKTWQLINVARAVKHDIAIVSVSANTPHDYPGRIVNITVLVQNNGEAPETFNVTAYRDTVPIETLQVSNLDIEENTTIIFHWNTSGLTPCHNWTISAEAPLAEDINPADNRLVDGSVKIKMFCDVNADGVVDIFDVVLAAVAIYAKPSDPRWNPQVDVAPRFGYIDLYDFVTIVYHYGEKCP